MYIKKYLLAYLAIIINTIGLGDIGLFAHRAVERGLYADAHHTSGALTSYETTPLLVGLLLILLATSYLVVQVRQLPTLTINRLGQASKTLIIWNLVALAFSTILLPMAILAGFLATRAVMHNKEYHEASDRYLIKLLGFSSLAIVVISCIVSVALTLNYG